MRAGLVALAMAAPLGTTLSARQLPAELAATASASDRAATYIATTDRYEAAGRPPIAITIVSKSSAADRAVVLATESKRALALLDEWLGPLATSALTIVDVPWNSRLVGATPAGLVTVRSRWIAPVRDRSLERELIAGIARQYWPQGGDAFSEGLVLYLGGRAIDEQLEGSQFYADRYLGGFLPFPLRSLSLSPAPKDPRPRLRRYDELASADPAAQRIARALEVAERFLGWPAMQQAVHAFRQAGAGGMTAFVQTLSAERGHDASWLFADSVREGAKFDYAVSLASSPSANGQYDVRVTIDRRGDAAFAQLLPVETRFADGTSIRDRWDARQPQVVIDYVSASPAIAAAIDPEVILILDEARANNVVTTEPRPWNRLALKLACDWAIWLQQAMLAYSGIV